MIQRWMRARSAAALWMMTVLFVSAASFAATPGKVKYQGSLRENGVAVTGQRMVSFGLFTQAAGGTAVWESGDIAVNVSNGLFTCELTPGGIDWSAGPYYLEVRVNGATLSPREEITSTVYALQARSVDDGAVTAAKIADGAITSVKLAAGSVTDDKVVSVSWSKITGVPAGTVSTETVAGMQAEIAALKVSTGVLAADAAVQQAQISGVQGDIAGLKASTGALAGQVSGKYDKTGGVLSGDLDATGYRITASTIGSAGTKLYGDGSGLTGLPGGADNLGNHTATQNLNLAGNAVVNVSSVAVGAAAAEFKLTLDDDGGILAKGTYDSGAVLTSTGAGTRMIWYPRRAAFRAGSVTGAQWDAGNVAPYSVALGINTTASGMTSTAMGAGTTASGDVSTAIGYYTTASGNYSAAMGVGTTASGVGSTAIGNYTTASGNYSTAMGAFTTASGGGSTVMGSNTTASGVYSVAMGVGFTNERENSLGIGYQGVAGSTRTPDISLSPSSHSWLNAEVGNVGIGTINPEFKLTLGTDGGLLAKGTYNSGAVLTSTGAGTRMIWYPRRAAFRAGGVTDAQWDAGNVAPYSVAMGYNTTASGAVSTAMGSSTTASGYYSTAMGWNTTASEAISTAMGAGTTASGNYSTSMGYNTTASGAVSTAMGAGTTASGAVSTAIGNYTTASGAVSTAMGSKTTASGYCSVAMGENFTNPYVSSLGIGYDGVGTSTTTPDILLNPNGHSWLNATTGYVLVHTTAPFTGRTEVFQVNGSGYASAWNTPSDQRLKKNIATISGALDRVLKLRGVTYEWKDPERHGGQTGRQMGFIAQEAKDVIPEVVSGGEDGEYAVAYGPVVALLVEAVKEQAAQNQRLEQRNRELEERLRVLEQRLGVR